MISYFKRKSQNLSTAIEAIYGLRVSNDTDKSLKLAAETYAGMIDFELEKILNCSPEEFINRIIELNFTAGFIHTLVKLMIETAEIYKSLQKENETENLRFKALQLLKYLKQTDRTYSEEREQQIIYLEQITHKI